MLVCIPIFYSLIFSFILPAWCRNYENIGISSHEEFDMGFLYIRSILGTGKVYYRDSVTSSRPIMITAQRWKPFFYFWRTFEREVTILVSSSPRSRLHSVGYTRKSLKIVKNQVVSYLKVQSSYKDSCEVFFLFSYNRSFWSH